MKKYEGQIKEKKNPGMIQPLSRTHILPCNCN